MKVCPQCTSTRVRFSHTRTLFESFLRTGLGFRFYRCQECSWRGMERPVKKINKYSGKKSIWVILGIYALAIFLVLYIVFVVIGVGGTPPIPPQ